MDFLMVFFFFLAFFNVNLLVHDFVQKGPLCSDTVVGQGTTSAWKMCGLDKATTLCLIFEIAKKDRTDTTVQQPSSYQFYFQFLT
jgi:protein transport protein SEC23